MKKIETGKFKYEGWNIIITLDNGKWHLSMARQDRDNLRAPTYDELKKVRYRFLPADIYVGQIFPPKNEFINLTEAYHLWEL